MHWLRKHRVRILLVVISGFILSTFIGFGYYLRSGASIVDEVAEVNNEKIPYRHFKTLFNQVVNNRRDRGEQLTPETVTNLLGIPLTPVRLKCALLPRDALRKAIKFDTI